jgi:3-methyl-2-oxobutanoate hydroxymethyltransferase
MDTMVTVPKIMAMKGHEKIVALTAYDFCMASLLDAADVDLLLVGDSAAMVFSGESHTLSFTMDEALYHCRAVRRGIRHSLLVADMPFLSYQINAEQAIQNAGRFFKEAHVDAVKLEGGAAVAESVQRIVQAGMPVMGHLGLTPQSIRRFGGYGLQATDAVAAEQLLQDALALQQAGSFSIVLEKIPAALADRVTKTIAIPTIGIGAGPHCDGQILVTHDLLGLFEQFQPKFVRRYVELGQAVRQACRNYADDVHNGRFPSLEESF